MAFPSHGVGRFRRLSSDHQKYLGRPMRGCVLDFGCGAGGMIFAGLEQGLDIYGVEVEENRERSYRTNVGYLPADKRSDAHTRFKLYDGTDLPFPARHFDAVISNFVFEHVPDVVGSLRQIARVLKKGGAVLIHAEDARNAWEGHPKIPWPPFLPRRYTKAYLEEYGADTTPEHINSYCYYVSAPMVTSTLETFGVEIVHANDRPVSRFPEVIYIQSDDDARAAARIAKSRHQSGEWPSPKQNLEVIGVKQID